MNLFKAYTSFLYQILLQDQKRGHDKVRKRLQISGLPKHIYTLAETSRTKTTGIQGKKFKQRGEAETGWPVHLLHHLGFVTTTISALEP